jgi:hypothetical protein
MVTGSLFTGAKRTSRVRTGIALSATSLCAADIRIRGVGDRSWRAALEPPAADGSSWPSLASALGDLAKAVGTTDGSLAIALLPPLTEVRRIELPPLSRDDLHQALSRHAARYFVQARTPQVVGATIAGKRTRGAPTPVIAASASARLIATLRAAAEQAGWSVESIAPAESAWAAAAVSLWPALARQDGVALIASSDRTDLVQISAGRLTGMRRFRAGAADAGMIADALPAGARVGLAGDDIPRRALSAELKRAGVSLATALGDHASDANDAPLLAAHFAGDEIGPTLRSIDVVALVGNRARRAAWTLWVAAAVILVAAAGVHLWGLRHQLQAIRAERERLRPQLASTLMGRSTADVMSRHLATLDGIERSSPQWSQIISALSAAVPEEAYLTAIRGRQDSLIVDGLAEHAARVFDALQNSNVLLDVKSAAPVRREQQEDGTALDRFTIAGRLAPPPMAAPTTSSAALGAARRIAR